MPRPRPEVVGLLEAWLEAAWRGEIRELCILGRDGEGDWHRAYAADDLDDMVLELRTQAIRLQCDRAREDTEPVPQ